MILNVIVIPTLRPDDSLINLITNLNIQLKNQSLYSSTQIIVISDGNTKNENNWLQNSLSENCTIIYHAVNLGKGRALKTAFNHILTEFEYCQNIITADADGQHLPVDILKILVSLHGQVGKTMMMGFRYFDQKKVPLRSRIGNQLTKWFFQFFVGLKLNDTQTGLRGLKKECLEQLLTVSGERYEYETNMLLTAKTENWSIVEEKITTVYIDNNKKSHFNPLYDSMRIYFLIFRFMSSSILSSGIDICFFSLFLSFKFSILDSTLLARFISGWFNFYLNHKIVFKNATNFKISLIRYWALVVVMGFLSSLVTQNILIYLKFPVIAKLVSETFLFIVSFVIQKELIFNKKKLS